MMVGVFIRHADNAEDANQQCRGSPAYRKILLEYPSIEWERRHVKTARHNTGPSGTPELKGPGAYMVEFEVTRRTTPPVA